MTTAIKSLVIPRAKPSTACASSAVDGGQNPTTRQSVWSDAAVPEMLDDVLARATACMKGYNDPSANPWSWRHTGINDRWVNTSRGPSGQSLAGLAAPLH